MNASAINHEKVRLEYLDKGFKFSYAPEGYFATKGNEVHVLDTKMNLIRKTK